MKAEQIIKIMESHYPLSCQEDWDGFVDYRQVIFIQK